MKIVLAFLIQINISYAFYTQEEINIEGKSFRIVHESYDDYGEKGIAMKLYKKGDSDNSKPRFSFTLENQSGGCGEQSRQEGTYELNGTQLTLYSHWDRSGRAYDTPKGDRIQHYKIDKNGSVSFLDGRLYIEAQSKNYDKQSAIQYLYEAPKNATEENALERYKKRVEEHFKGKFVHQKERKQLHQQVENALMQKRKTRWQ